MSTQHLLLLAADLVDDLEASRIANENRLRSLAEYGLEGTPEHDALAAVVKGLADLEHTAELNLCRVVRKHPLGAWVKATVGVGEKQGARLLAAIGDPYWNTLHDRPRTVSELWAYCGYHTLPASHCTTATHIASAAGATSSVGQSTSGTQARIADGTTFPASHKSLRAHESNAGGARSSVDQSTDRPQTPAVDGTNSRTAHATDEIHGYPVGAGQASNIDHRGIGTQTSRVNVAARRRRGERANWSATGKMRAYLVAESSVKILRAPCATSRDGDGPVVHQTDCVCSPYRRVYDQRRRHTADRTHATTCVRCGPAGKPALPGSPWSPGHQHADALRIAAKQILKDLWLEARELHQPITVAA